MDIIVVDALVKASSFMMFIFLLQKKLRNHCGVINMTKTPKNGSASSTPTPGGAGSGNPGSVGTTGAPPSVGSTKSEPNEAGGGLDSTASHAETPGGRSGTPHSIPENASSSGNKEASEGDSNNATSAMNGGTTSTDGLLCDNGLETASASAGGGSNSAHGTPDNSNEGGPGSVGGAQIKTEQDVKPSLSNSSTPLPSSTNNPLPPDADLFDGFDSKDGGTYDTS